MSSTADLLDTLADAYADEPFVVVSERSPSTKAAQGSNCAHLSARYDERTGTVIVLSAIDNLVKGTAGQALQCMNLMVGLASTPASRPSGSHRERHRDARPTPRRSRCCCRRCRTSSASGATSSS